MAITWSGTVTQVGTPPLPAGNLALSHLAQMEQRGLRGPRLFNLFVYSALFHLEQVTYLSQTEQRTHRGLRQFNLVVYLALPYLEQKDNHLASRRRREDSKKPRKVNSLYIQRCLTSSKMRHTWRRQIREDSGGQGRSSLCPHLSYDSPRVEGDSPGVDGAGRTQGSRQVNPVSSPQL